MTKRESISSLERGLETKCADDIVQVLCNLDDGTCDYVELIPLLEKIAEQEWFYYFDDNGAGGFPRPSGEPISFRQWALKAIENIKENSKLKTNSVIGKNLKGNDVNTLKSTLKSLSKSNSCDETLIPILEKIAKKDSYNSYSYIGGYSTPRRFGELAQKAIEQIKRNIEKNEL